MPVNTKNEVFRDIFPNRSPLLSLPMILFALDDVGPPPAPGGPPKGDPPVPPGPPPGLPNMTECARTNLPSPLSFEFSFVCFDFFLRDF